MMTGSTRALTGVRDVVLKRAQALDVLPPGGFQKVAHKPLMCRTSLDLEPSPCGGRKPEYGY